MYLFDIPTPPNNNLDSTKTIFLILGIALVLVAVLLITYFIVKGKKKKK